MIDTEMADSQQQQQQAEEMAVVDTPPPSSVFVPPSINESALLAGDSYSYFSPVPTSLRPPPGSPPSATGPPCVLGVDEAGRGPVLGPMVYGVFYLPIPLSDSLLRSAPHRFDDSKVLTPAVRASLLRALCTPSTDLHSSCGWAVTALSARDISAGMLRPGPGAAAGGGGGGAAPYNLNAQAMDATVELIRQVYARGVNVREIYVDTIGQPAAYQAKLERVFPTAKITVAKKADSLYPCVSAASVCAKVTRDVALEILWKARGGKPRGGQLVGGVEEGGEELQQDREEEGGGEGEGEEAGEKTMAWGSGYPSDGRCVAWLKGNMHPLFGWGPECRFSWGTAKDMLEAAPAKGGGVKVDWPVDEDDDTHRVTDFFASGIQDKAVDELGAWFGTPTGLEAF
ncbi:hypothetical protein VTH82DRAFT_347 [Thermothelomyces myriococcoides]